MLGLSDCPSLPFLRSVGLQWKAPETFVGQFTTASDIFGFGVTCFELLSRRHPFEGKTQPEIIKMASAKFEVNSRLLRLGISEEEQRLDWDEEYPLEERRSDISAVEAECPEGVVELMQRCWADQIAARPTAEVLVAELQRLGRAHALAEAEAAEAAEQARREAAAAEAAAEAAAAAGRGGRSERRCHAAARQPRGSEQSV